MHLLSSLALFGSLLFVTSAHITTDSTTLSANTLSSVKQISRGFFDCNSSDYVKRKLCKLLLDDVNSKLKSAGFAIKSNELLFKVDDNQVINAGSSCSLRKEIRRNQAWVAAKGASKPINLSGKSFSKPFVLNLRLPVLLTQRVDVRLRAGARFLGKCRRIARASAVLAGKLDTMVDIFIKVSINPNAQYIRTGDWALTIRPEIVIGFSLKNVDVPLKVVKQNKWTKALEGVIKTFAKIRKVPLSNRNLQGVLENKLNTIIKRALNIGSDGKRIIMIHKDYASMLKGGNTNIFRMSSLLTVPEGSNCKLVYVKCHESHTCKGGRCTPKPNCKSFLGMLCTPSGGQCDCGNFCTEVNAASQEYRCVPSYF